MASEMVQRLLSAWRTQGVLGCGLGLERNLLRCSQLFAQAPSWLLLPYILPPVKGGQGTVRVLLPKSQTPKAGLAHSEGARGEEKGSSRMWGAGSSHLGPVKSPEKNVTKVNMKPVQRRKTQPEVISQLTPPPCRSDIQTLCNFHDTLALLAVEKGAP